MAEKMVAIKNMDEQTWREIRAESVRLGIPVAEFLKRLWEQYQRPPRP